MKPHVITIYGDSVAGFRWTRRAGNHRTVAAASEGYARKQGAVRNMLRVNADAEECAIRDFAVSRSDLSRGPVGGESE